MESSVWLKNTSHAIYISDLSISVKIKLDFVSTNKRSNLYNERFLLEYLSLSMGILFFTMGQFEFFDMLRAKRLVQIILLFVVAIIGFSVWWKHFLLPFRQPLYLLIFLFIFSELFRFDVKSALEMITTLFLVALIFTMAPKYSNLVLKVIIVIACIFSILGIIEAWILVANPELLDHTTIFLIQPVKEGEYFINHPIAYLGMTPGQVRSFFGLEIPRMQSFLREPGLIPVYFLIPGVLALTYKGPIKLASIPLIFFSMLGFTGTVYLSIIFAVFYFMLRVFVARKKERILSVAALSIVLVSLITIHWTDFAYDIAFLMYRNDAFLENISNVEFLDRYGTTVGRLDELPDFMEEASGPGGSSGKIPAFVGLVMFGFFKGNIIGMFLVILVLFQLFQTSSALYIKKKVFAGVCPMICGIYMQVGMFSLYGFTSASGYMITALTLMRLRNCME